MEYLPFGELLVDEHTNSYNSPFKYNGKEFDEETGNYFYGARYYDPRTSIFLSVDPEFAKFPSWSPYNYTLQNPIRFVDPDGRAPEDVIIVFNKSTGKLAIIDLDHYQKGLPTKTVSAKDYVHGGIRGADGKLTHNQVLVMENVFSGGKSTNGVVERDLESSPNQLPIPNGRYDLLEYEGGNGWYKVDPIDESRYDDHHQGEKNAQGKTRNGYRLHLGTVSHGCITCDTSQGDRKEEWNVLETILENTSKTTVPKREGNQ